MTERCKANPCCGEHYGKCEVPLPQHRSGLWFHNTAEYRDNYAVDQFAEAMKAKLAKKRAEGRGGWDRKDECSKEFLSQLLRDHIEKGDPVDVANFCMMLQQRGERISSPGKDGGQDTAIADELTDALDGAFVTTTSGGGQRPYLTVMFTEKNQVNRLYDALAAFSSLRRMHANTQGPDADPELLEVLKELCTRIGPRWFLEQNWSAPLDVIAKAEATE